MARSGPGARPGRPLLALFAFLAIIFGAVGAGAAWSNASWSPKLALDLEGGRQLILTPVPQEGQTQANVTQAQLNEAVNIIRQRVDGSGVAEAEVTTSGKNIVVALPGTPDRKTIDLVKQSAELTFRPVLVAASTAPAETATPTPTGSSSATPSPGATGGKGDGEGEQASTPQSTSGRIVPQALAKAGASEDPSAQTGTTDPGAGAGDTSQGAGTPSDMAQITEKIGKEFEALDCSKLEPLQLRAPDPKKPLVTCSNDGAEKYILGPVEVRGADISGASASLGTNQQGFSTGEWGVDLTFDANGAKAFAAVTARLADLTGNQNRFAVVLDNLVISAPGTNERIPGGQARISGSFNQESAASLASQLKFGALPISFRVETEEQISALLGKEQLQRGLLAGLIGLGLVVVYSLLQYRGLGMVTVASLIVAAALNFGLILLLSWQQNYRLSLAGVTGFIVSIGVTADSFIVFFERVRDEVREGRPLRAAVEAAWVRARRTIIASDVVSILAAVVLYVLAVGGVRGFAFTLGLTTLVDIVVVFLFTKPMVTLLARTKFFGGGHPLSGFSPEQLGRAATGPTYTGRGRIRPPTGQSIAARRAAERRGQTGDDDPGGPGGSSTVGAGSRRDV